MIPNFKFVFSSKPQPKKAPRGKQVRGSYEELIPHVRHDIEMTKAQLHQYDGNTLLNKLTALMESDHEKMIQQLQKECERECDCGSESKRGKSSS